MRKKCNFFEGQKHSVTHNQFRQTLQSLFVMEWKTEREGCTDIIIDEKGTIEHENDCVWWNEMNGDTCE